MKVFLILVCTLVGFACGLAVMAVYGKIKLSNAHLKKVTRFIFVTTQVSALIWVFTSYAIAIYSTVRLGQVYTMSELSEPAINTILGVGFLKVLENIFEHNEGFIFGTCKKEGDSND